MQNRMLDQLGDQEKLQQEMIKKADSAMYEAKKSGKNRLMRYQEEE